MSISFSVIFLHFIWHYRGSIFNYSVAYSIACDLGFGGTGPFLTFRARGPGLTQSGRRALPARILEFHGMVSQGCSGLLFLLVLSGESEKIIPIYNPYRMMSLIPSEELVRLVQLGLEQVFGSHFKGKY